MRGSFLGQASRRKDGEHRPKEKPLWMQAASERLDEQEVVRKKKAVERRKQEQEHFLSAAPSGSNRRRPLDEVGSGSGSNGPLPSPLAKLVANGGGGGGGDDGGGPASVDERPPRGRRRRCGRPRRRPGRAAASSTPRPCRRPTRAVPRRRHHPDECRRVGTQRVEYLGALPAQHMHSPS